MLVDLVMTDSRTENTSSMTFRCIAIWIYQSFQEWCVFLLTWRLRLIYFVHSGIFFVDLARGFMPGANLSDS